MAHHKSAQKRIRQTERRTAVNRARTSRIKTIVKKVEVALTGTDQKAALEALRTAQSEIMSGVSKGVINKNAASRKVSRLAARVKALGTKAA